MEILLIPMWEPKCPPIPQCTSKTVDEYYTDMFYSNKTLTVDSHMGVRFLQSQTGLGTIVLTIIIMLQKHLIVSYMTYI